MASYAEPSWARGEPSPHYGPQHFAWRAHVRAWVDRELLPHISTWEAAGAVPVRELAKRCADAGIYGAAYPRELGGTPPPDWDEFMHVVTSDELARCGAGGVVTALMVGVSIGLGPVVASASPALRARVVPAVLAAREFICLAVTEPTAGSDVASVRTRATLDADGTHYVVTGEKKFISGAAYADWFTTAVQTDHGVSLLLVPRGPGVQVRRMPTQGWRTSETGYVTFDAVRVPRDHLLGTAGQGFKLIMANFNRERFVMAVSCCRYSRLLLDAAVSYARQRVVFGEPLWSSAVIRAKVAEMVRRIEGNWAWLESLAFMVQRGAKPATVAGPIALLKVACSQCFEYCAREASQIMGGASYVSTGVGELVERLYREVRIQAIGGGSEEVMSELAMRQMTSKL